MVRSKFGNIRSASLTGRWRAGHEPCQSTSTASCPHLWHNSVPLLPRQEGAGYQSQIASVNLMVSAQSLTHTESPRADSVSPPPGHSPTRELTDADSPATKMLHRHRARKRHRDGCKEPLDDTAPTLQRWMSWRQACTASNRFIMRLII
jgi:hypothetical protein